MRPLLLTVTASPAQAIHISCLDKSSCDLLTDLQAPVYPSLSLQPTATVVPAPCRIPGAPLQAGPASLPEGSRGRPEVLGNHAMPHSAQNSPQPMPDGRWYINNPAPSISGLEQRWG